MYMGPFSALEKHGVEGVDFSSVLLSWMEYHSNSPFSLSSAPFESLVVDQVPFVSHSRTIIIETIITLGLVSPSDSESLPPLTIFDRSS